MVQLVGENGVAAADQSGDDGEVRQVSASESSKARAFVHGATHAASSRSIASCGAKCPEMRCDAPAPTP